MNETTHLWSTDGCEVVNRSTIGEDRGALFCVRAVFLCAWSRNLRFPVQKYLRQGNLKSIDMEYIRTLNADCNLLVDCQSI